MSIPGLGNVIEIFKAGKASDVVLLLKTLDPNNATLKVMKAAKPEYLKLSAHTATITLLLSFTSKIVKLFPHTHHFIVAEENLKQIMQNIGGEELLLDSMDGVYNKSGDLYKMFGLGSDTTDQKNASTTETATTENEDDGLHLFLALDDFEEYLKEFDEEQKTLLRLKRETKLAEMKHHLEMTTDVIECFWNSVNKPELIKLFQRHDASLFLNEAISSQVSWLHPKIFCEGLTIENDKYGNLIGIKNYKGDYIDPLDPPPEDAATLYQQCQAYDTVVAEQKSLVKEFWSTFNNLILLCKISCSISNAKLESLFQIIIETYLSFMDNKIPLLSEVPKVIISKSQMVLGFDNKATSEIMTLMIELLFHNQNTFNRLFNMIKEKIPSEIREVLKQVGYDLNNADKFKKMFDDRVAMAFVDRKKRLESI